VALLHCRCLVSWWVPYRGSLNAMTKANQDTTKQDPSWALGMEWNGSFLDFDMFVRLLLIQARQLTYQNQDHCSSVVQCPTGTSALRAIP
jgi:hypothetical protein